MTVYLLPDEPEFPPASDAEPDGLIAIGGDLSPARLIRAYASGIFPWFIEDGDVFWYSPDPRMVLFPDEFKLRGTLKRTLKKRKFEIRSDTSFLKVIKACAGANRRNQEGTWISAEFIRAYHRLFDMGYAHSFETYLEGRLVGGLYGLSMGHVFFGESMFFEVTDASKAALHGLITWCMENKISLIDCQVESDHLKRLGARSIRREDYMLLLKKRLS